MDYRSLLNEAQILPVEDTRGAVLVLEIGRAHV